MLVSPPHAHPLFATCGTILVLAEPLIRAQPFANVPQLLVTAMTTHPCTYRTPHPHTHLHHASVASTDTAGSSAAISCRSSVSRPPAVMKGRLSWLVAAQRTMGTSVDASCAGGMSDATCGTQRSWLQQNCEGVRTGKEPCKTNPKKREGLELPHLCLTASLVSM